jgi:hypothetical protein
MANLEWNGGVCPAQPGLPNLLLLSLESVRVRDPPEFVYQEYERYGTLRCKVLIFVGRSTLYPDIEPWFISTIGFRFQDTYPNAARKALRRLRVVYRQHLIRTPMGFFPPSRGRGRSWIDRMRTRKGRRTLRRCSFPPVYLPQWPRPPLPGTSPAAEAPDRQGGKSRAKDIT